MCRVTKYATGYIVSEIRPPLRGPVQWFADRYVDKFSKEVSYNKREVITKEIVGQPFYCAMANLKEYRFHINTLEAFYTFIGNKGYSRDCVEVVTLDRNYPIAPAKFNWVSSKGDRDEQIKPMQFLMEPETMRVAELQTGSGKTYMTQKVLYMSKMRAMIIMKPQYIDRWVCEEGLGADLGIDISSEEDLTVVRSTGELISLINAALEGDIIGNVIVIHNTVLRSYINYYFASNGFDDVYGCRPEMLMQLLGVGIRVMEEAHQDINLNYKLDCCFNTWKTIYLSATLTTNSSWFMKKIYENMFAQKDRITMEYKIYTKIKSYTYFLENPKKIKYNGYMGLYNHALFENSIQKMGLVDKYFEVIYYMLEDTYFPAKKDGQKAIIYLYKTDMCIALAKRLKVKYPQVTSGYKIGGISDAVGYANDIIVTTLGSTGTGKDIPNVLAVLLSVSINSEQANEQAKGRARKPNDDSIPVFGYCYSPSVQKHIDYHNEKKRIFNGRVLGYMDINTGIRV